MLTPVDDPSNGVIYPDDPAFDTSCISPGELCSALNCLAPEEQPLTYENMCRAVGCPCERWCCGDLCGDGPPFGVVGGVVLSEASAIASSR